MRVRDSIWTIDVSQLKLFLFRMCFVVRPARFQDSVPRINLRTPGLRHCKLHSVQ